MQYHKHVVALVNLEKISHIVWYIKKDNPNTMGVKPIIICLETDLPRFVKCTGCGRVYEIGPRETTLDRCYVGRHERRRETLNRPRLTEAELKKYAGKFFEKIHFNQI